MTRLIPSLRPFAAWVTDLTDRYRFDPNVRATVHIVLLQLGLTLLSVFIFGWALQYAERDTVGSIAAHIRALVAGGVAPDSLPQALDAVRMRTYVYVFTGLILLNVIFGYLIALFALRPARQNLSFQKRFISDISHEIRTPLAIIKTSTEVTLLDPELPKGIRKTMEETIGELNRISETINNLLSLDSLMRPRSMRFTPVNFSDIVRTVVERHRDLAQSRGIELSASIADNAMVTGNATALEQVATNLVKNAINFTPKDKDGKVQVDVERAAAGSTSFTVTDTGIGIAEKDLYHIFEPFYRADTSRARGIGTGSSGLGLAIVHENVRIHKGTITLRSAVGHGTTIKITFPVSKEARQELPLLAPSGSPHEATIDFS